MNFLSQTPGFFIYALKQASLRRVWAAVVLLLAADILLLIVFWLPASWHHHDLQNQIDAVRSRQQEAQKAQQTAGDYSWLMKRAKTIESKLETPSSQSKLIESLTQLAAHDRLRVVSQDFDAVKNGPAESLKQNMTVEGSYSSVRHYLTDLENLPTLTLARQIRLDRAGQGSGLVRAELTLWTFEKSGGH